MTEHLKCTIWALTPWQVTAKDEPSLERAKRQIASMKDRAVMSGDFSISLLPAKVEDMRVEFS